MPGFALRAFIVAAALLLISFAIVGNEGPADYAAENRWTLNHGQFESSLQYVLINDDAFRKAEAALAVGAVERRHFGWPMWALYVDSSVQGGHWCAKLDTYRLIANFALFCIPGLLFAAAVAIGRTIRKNRTNAEAPGTQLT